MSDEGVIEAIADFVIGGPIRLIIKLFKFGKDQLSEQRVEQIIAANEAQTQSQSLARKLHRDQQLETLNSAVPATPPQRMRATIQVNQYTVPRYDARKVLGKYVDIEAGDSNRYSVDMILELTEAERGLIKEYQLADIVLEKHLRYDEEDLARLAQIYEHMVEGSDDYTKDFFREDTQKSINEARTETIYVRIVDLLAHPFSREFKTAHQAKLYADSLKTKVLPELRKLLDSYADHKPTDTIEF